jgi:hypothetical protein
MRFYLTATCGNCDEDIAYGPCLTLVEYDGLPAISYDMAAQQNFYCEHCRANNYTGDFEMFTEGGDEPPDEDEDEEESNAA